MFVGIVNKAKHVKFLVNDNSTAILTGMGVAGTVATAYLSGRASFRAAQIIQQEKDLIDVLRGEQEEERPPDLTTVRKVKLVWREYLPPVAVGSVTVTSILVANRVASKKIAALTIASGISERALNEYKDKVIEKLGPNQDRAVRDQVAQDRVTNEPVGGREIIITGNGEVLCYDMTSGRYFQSTIEDIKRAENRINYELIHYMSASLSMFYEEIGLPPTSHSDSVGWNMNNHIEVEFSTTMSSDNRPCIAIDFKRQPTSDYNRTAWDTGT